MKPNADRARSLGVVAAIALGGVGMLGNLQAIQSVINAPNWPAWVTSAGFLVALATLLHERRRASRLRVQLDSVAGDPLYSLRLAFHRGSQVMEKVSRQGGGFNLLIPEVHRWEEHVDRRLAMLAAERQEQFKSDANHIILGKQGDVTEEDRAWTRLRGKTYALQQILQVPGERDLF